MAAPIRQAQSTHDQVNTMLIHFTTSQHGIYYTLKGVSTMARKRKVSGFYQRNGRYEYRFTVNGKRTSVCGHTIEECKSKALRRQQELIEGRYKPGKELTISEFFERWIEGKRDVREATIRTNRTLFKAIENVSVDSAGRKFGNLKITKIETQNIRDLQAALKQGRSTRTVNDSISMLKGIFKSAIDERILTWNPCGGVRPLKRTEPAARDNIHRALTVEETNRFLDHAADSWYSELFLFLLNTGCRIGEAGAIMTKDVAGGIVHINKTITRAESGGYFIGADTKTKSGTRTIPLNKAASEAIQSQKQKNALLYWEKVTSLQETIFKATRGGLIKESIINTEIAKICKAAGIERFTVHAFRDTFATRCVESGMQPKTLQDIMGHSDIGMTMNLYAHTMNETKEEQLKVVNFR